LKLTSAPAFTLVAIHQPDRGLAVVILPEDVGLPSPSKSPAPITCHAAPGLKPTLAPLRILLPLSARPPGAVGVLPQDVGLAIVVESPLADRSQTGPH